MNECGKPVAIGPGNSGKFCSRSCAASFNNRLYPKRKPTHNCKGVKCTNKVRAGISYCSPECRPERKPVLVASGAATFSKPKRYQDYCSCGKTKNKQSVKCYDCRNYDYLMMTLGELKEKSVRDAQVYNALRQRSRTIAKSLGLLEGCQVCGYSYRVEIAHINDLAKLPNSTTVFEATDSSNFFALCPNHHHEFDDGHLTADDICSVLRSRT